MPGTGGYQFGQHGPRPIYLGQAALYVLEPGGGQGTYSGAIGLTIDQVQPFPDLVQPEAQGRGPTNKLQPRQILLRVQPISGVAALRFRHQGLAHCIQVDGGGPSEPPNGH